jgi:hypothetical protein
MKFSIAFALLAQVAAECPNACSGHGECGTKDMCECYANYQGNDCSERTCYFGLAHVDTPKGDLNSDNAVSGPLVTVITGSETYPWGTEEQYPNADANEGYFYMECSNKGICDRKSGECECFDGYEGTACVRASCPNDCSGHGTCESIRELAEMKSFDTTASHASSAQPNSRYGATGIEESYGYNLWDADKTMGCKCDPVYHGADCSQRKCKYGVDPMFEGGETKGIIHQASVVHLGSKGANAAAIGGTFSIDFFDVFGEKYTTKPLDASTSLTAAQVTAAFEALPNDVIQKDNYDVTAIAPAAVDVSMHDTDGDITYDGSLGAGAAGESGAGLGVFGGFGPEFTVTFSTNPGILKTIELDTRQVTNAGTTDYWVANLRQGQFESRYVTKKERINTLLYGSKHLYTNSDPADLVSADDLIKIDGQEFLVSSVDSDFNIIVLNEAFLGASIYPIMTDTLAVASALHADGNKLTLDSAIVASQTDSLTAGSMLYCQDQPFVVQTGASATDTFIEFKQDGNDATKEPRFYFATGQLDTIFRRSDNFDNQNFYAAESDSATEPTEKFCATRGSADIFGCAAEENTASIGGDGTVTFANAPTAVANTGVWIGTEGPYKVASVATAVVTFDDNNVEQTTVSEYLGASAVANFIIPTFYSTSVTSTTITKVVIINGRRYRVASDVTEGTADGMNEVIGTKITLTETFSGPHLRQICASCISSVATAASGQQVLTVADGFTFSLAAGQPLLVGSVQGYDNLVYNNADFDGADGTTNRDITVNEYGTSSEFASIADTLTDLDLYTLTTPQGFTPVFVTESQQQPTYSYVTQCSNRGVCDGTTGLCTCFKGYSGDNCNSQNMLAA